MKLPKLWRAFLAAWLASCAGITPAPAVRESSDERTLPPNSHPR